MGMDRRKFAREFSEAAVLRLASGAPMGEVARLLPSCQLLLLRQLDIETTATANVPKRKSNTYHVPC